MKRKIQGKGKRHRERKGGSEEVKDIQKRGRGKCKRNGNITDTKKGKKGENKNKINFNLYSS